MSPLLGEAASSGGGFFEALGLVREQDLGFEREPRSEREPSLVKDIWPTDMNPFGTSLRR